MTDEQTPTIADAFEAAIENVYAARESVDELRKVLRFRVLTAKDADRIRRMSITLSTDEQVLMQLRDLAADRMRRDGTLA